MVIADGEALDECDEGFGKLFREDSTKKVANFFGIFLQLVCRIFAKQLKACCCVHIASEYLFGFLLCFGLC
jgi:hypothetical protein